MFVCNISVVSRPIGEVAGWAALSFSELERGVGRLVSMLVSVANGATAENGLCSFQAIRLLVSLRGLRRPSSYVPISSFLRHAIAIGSSAVLAEDRAGKVKTAAVADKEEGMVVA